MKSNRKLFWLTLGVSLVLGAFTATAWWIAGAEESDIDPKEISFEKIRQADFHRTLEYYADQSRGELK